MKTNTNERRKETMATIRFFAIAALILLISITVVITVTKTHAIKEMREDGRLLTITSFYEEEPHRETVGMWDYDNNTTNEHYTNIEYYEYSGTFVVEVSTYDGEYIGKFEVKPKYYGEDKISIGAEIERYKLQEIKRDIEKIKREAPNKELLQDIEPLSDEEAKQIIQNFEKKEKETRLKSIKRVK